MRIPKDGRQNETFLRLYAEREASLQTFMRAIPPMLMEASEMLQNVIVVLWQKRDSALDFKKMGVLSGPSAGVGAAR